jgi:hypothetical protein
VSLSSNGVIAQRYGSDLTASIWAVIWACQASLADMHPTTLMGVREPDASHLAGSDQIRQHLQAYTAYIAVQTLSFIPGLVLSGE